MTGNYEEKLSQESMVKKEKERRRMREIEMHRERVSLSKNECASKILA